ncbi:MAG: hypothetical protein WBR35_08050, partial [Anaerolineae bacterium]
QRFDLDTVMSLIGQKKYFLLHAPRQTGKTSCLLALMTHLNQGDVYRALYANIEAAQAVREDVTAGITAVVQTIAERARMMLIELKLLHRTIERTLADGLTQTWHYADACGADEAHLIIFDRRPGRTWQERIYRRDESYQQRLITLWGV